MNLATKDKYLEEAYDELEKISSGESKRIAYTSYLKKVMDDNTRIEEVKQEGAKEKELELIEYMHKKGFSEEFISGFLNDIN